MGHNPDRAHFIHWWYLAPVGIWLWGPGIGMGNMVASESKGIRKEEKAEIIVINKKGMTALKIKRRRLDEKEQNKKEEGYPKTSVKLVMSRSYGHPSAGLILPQEPRFTFQMPTKWNPSVWISTCWLITLVYLTRHPPILTTADWFPLFLAPAPTPGQLCSRHVSPTLA